MLTIEVPDKEVFNEATSEFIPVKGFSLRLEHSLYAIAKWESKWKKPFMGTNPKDQKTPEEMADYVRCMNEDDTISIVPSQLTTEQWNAISDYMNDTMTATWFNDKAKPSREIVTAEVVYYWMTALNIPFECQYWHYNRLMTLIHVCSIKSQPPKKMPKGETMRRNSALNAARRKAHGTKG